MDPDQTARMRRLVWIHAGRKPIMLVLSWHGSYVFVCFYSPVSMWWDVGTSVDSWQSGWTWLYPNNCRKYVIIRKWNNTNVCLCALVYIKDGHIRYFSIIRIKDFAYIFLNPRWMFSFSNSWIPSFVTHLFLSIDSEAKL
jgi:hypothetical protein